MPFIPQLGNKTELKWFSIRLQVKQVIATPDISINTYRTYISVSMSCITVFEGTHHMSV